MDKKTFLKEMYYSAFKDELEKLSSTAAVRAFRKGVLSEKGLENVVKFTGKTVGLKPLGLGSYQKADLVIDPEFGKSVMKFLQNNTTRINAKGKRINIINFNPSKDELKKRDKEYNAWMYLKKISKGKKDVQISQLKGRRGPIHFQEYSTPSQQDKMLYDNLKLAKIKMDNANIVRIDPITKKRMVGTDFHDKRRKAEDEYYNAVDAFKKKPELNDTTQKIINKFTKKYPEKYDIRIGNMSGGKLIDFEPGDKTYFGKKFINEHGRKAFYTIPPLSVIGIAAGYDMKKRKQFNKKNNYMNKQAFRERNE